MKLENKIHELKVQHNRELILKALKGDDTIYHGMVFEHGLEWIRNNMSLNDEQIVSVIGGCKLFWAWWRNQWSLRDEAYINLVDFKRHELPFENECLQVALELYNDTHNVNRLHIIPNRFVINEVSSALKAFTKLEVERLKTLIHGK
ncbi:hypothetical protein [Aurantibacillus circumpalustris]|uniref:hypothetical protein n=1 Tax=Aurantibacillus circumpalustris TaxID=3036359 RepID=UPI00295C01E2|nr:hypothetical protein [Aurantibacillus circumpalustris]